MNFDDSVAALDKACRDTFGTPITYIPAEARTAYSGTYPAIAIPFVGSQTEALGARLIGIYSLVTTLDLMLADLEIPPARGDSVVYKGVQYRIHEVTPVSEVEVLLVLVK